LEEQMPAETVPGAEDLDRAGRGRHGDPAPVPIDMLLGDDPDLWLVTADMGAWSAAHPCGCDALCECDQAA
jgi:hypothetical protein